MESSMRVHDARVSPLAVAADRVGATASFLCAVHCALLPFVIALLPLLGLGFLADHRFERIFVACAAALASVTIVTAWRRHRKLHALFLLVPGIALLLAGILIDIEHREWTHTVLVVCGGVLVASAHVVNLVLSHRHVHTAHCGHIV
jgi:MerC mercury resistance protein